MDDAAGSEEVDLDEGELVPRIATDADLIGLCRRLNSVGTRYVVVGGFAIIHAGYARMTEDLDLLIDTEPTNEAEVFAALESLPDKAVLQLEPGEVERYTVVRVADEIVVDLMASASGIRYEEAAESVVVRELDGVPIPFASPELLWRMKSKTHRLKDQLDLVFLREYFQARGEEPPAA